MGKHAGHHWHLSCRTDGCAWSTHVTIGDGDPRPQLLVYLRAHADQVLHGRRIEGVATTHNGDVTIIVLRHP